MPPTGWRKFKLVFKKKEPPLDSSSSLRSTRSRTKQTLSKMNLDEIRIVSETSWTSLKTVRSRHVIPARTVSGESFQRPGKRKAPTNNRIQVVALVHDEPKSKKLYQPTEVNVTRSEPDFDGEKAVEDSVVTDVVEFETTR